MAKPSDASKSDAPAPAPPPPLTHAAAKALSDAALCYPETVEEHPWGERAFKTRGKKTFCFLHQTAEGGFSATLKLPWRGEAVVARDFAAPAGYGLGKAGWVTARFGPEDAAPIDELVDWLDESWRAVAPKALVKTVPAPAAGEG